MLTGIREHYLTYTIRNHHKSLDEMRCHIHSTFRDSWWDIWAYKNKSVSLTCGISTHASFTKTLENLRLLPSKLFSPSWTLLSFGNPRYLASYQTVLLGCPTSISSPVCPKWNLSIQYLSLLLFSISVNSYYICQGPIRRQKTHSNLNRKWLI